MEVALKWLKTIFLPEIKPESDQHQILILNEHDSHIDAHQMYWECQALYASEDGTVHDSNPARRLKQSFNTNRPFENEFSDSSNHSLEESLFAFPGCWSRLLEEYTQTNLTKWTDKLPAVVGLAAAMARSSGNEYVAGLWWACWSLVAGKIWGHEEAAPVSRAFIVLGSSGRGYPIGHLALDL